LAGRYTPRAKRYRQFNGISDKLGTAANIQSMVRPSTRTMNSSTRHDVTSANAGSNRRVLERTEQLQFDAPDSNPAPSRPVLQVFGNMGEDSGTGVMFTRNPSTGANENFGEFLINAAGEDVVAGIRTPVDLKVSQGRSSRGARGDRALLWGTSGNSAYVAVGERTHSGIRGGFLGLWSSKVGPVRLTWCCLSQIMSKRQPEIYKELMDVNDMLERHYRDMQDIEFTVQVRTNCFARRMPNSRAADDILHSFPQEGKLYILQCRSGKRTAKAAVKMAVDMVKEGLINKEEVRRRKGTPRPPLGSEARGRGVAREVA
jgi:pyruvate, orthophosphate dikinase